ncbi:hypothetical protein RINTHM_1050 [Richelia intracellularis HM01]|nr:hypothetical protein RINTHM_1050 [Richelia intracellularis HM01]
MLLGAEGIVSRIGALYVSYMTVQDSVSKFWKVMEILPALNFIQGRVGSIYYQNFGK